MMKEDLREALPLWSLDRRGDGRRGPATAIEAVGVLLRIRISAVIAAFLLNMVSVSAAMSETNCIAATDAARREWRGLSHANPLRASQRIRTGDGRGLAGSQLNYSGVLIARAESACQSGQAEQALSYVNEVNKLLNPAPQTPVMSAAHSN
jgi:hypothetical protein